jgi:hypothetical protein
MAVLKVAVLIAAGLVAVAAMGVAAQTSTGVVTSAPPATSAAKNAMKQRTATHGAAVVAGATLPPPVSASPTTSPSLPVTPITTTPWSLLTATGAILAFLIGFYTLIGRERKSPYLINSVFGIVILSLVGAVIDLLALVVVQYQQVLVVMGEIILLLVVIIVALRIYKIYMRFVLFVDSPNPKQWYMVRWVKNWMRSLRHKKPYEHNAVAVPDTLKAAIVEILSVDGKSMEERDGLAPNSAAIALAHQGQANKYLAKIAKAFLFEGFAVQYVAASRHPIELIKYLKDQCEEDKRDSWKTTANLVVVVDAYTKHFGFTDSIYFDATRELKAMGVSYLAPAESYAGLHSATSQAFNKLQKQAKKSGSSSDNVRKPALIIYEDCYAITDLESSDQYRIFLRHVLPSERAWNGMFTVVAETVQAENDWKLLTSYTAFALDLRNAQIMTA